MKSHCKRGHPRISENLYPSGVCKICTKLRNDGPEMKAYVRRWCASTKGKASRSLANRKFKYQFTPEDEQKFQTIQNCEFCGLPFDGETPHVDHDHLCCPGVSSCGRCRRGFVHRLCNQHWILSLEWYEKKSGETDPKLAAYRAKFPLDILT